MHRFFIDPRGWDERRIRLSAAEEHHLLDVLRVAYGAQVIVFDGGGREAVAVVEPAEVCDGGVRVTPGVGTRLELRIVETRQVERAALRTVLIQALPKGRLMDEIVEKAVELGMAEIWPVVTDRVVARPAGTVGPKVDRWRRIVTSAAKQCRCSRLTAVDPPVSLNQALRRAEGFDLILLGSLDPAARTVREVLRETRQRPLRQVAVVIGPEGDLTALEHSQVVGAGGVAVSFGPLTLRVDTAAVYAMSVLAYEFAELPGSLALQPP